MHPTKSLLLPDINTLRKRIAKNGDLERDGAILRHIVTTNKTGFTDLRQFYAMLYSSKEDNWFKWISFSLNDELVTHKNRLMMDTWISSSIVLRVVLHTAWAVDSGALSKKEIKSIENTVIHICEEYVWPMFRGRAVECSPLDRGIELSNQVSGMLAGMLFTGHVFGYRLGRNKLARDLYARAKDAFSMIVGALDSDGYQGEGPIYQVNIESPGLILSSELLDEVEGGDHYNMEYSHPLDSRKKGTLANFVEASITYLYSPSGLSFPFDDYGPTRLDSGFPLVYAAKRSGERKFLDMLSIRGPFAAGTILWFKDDLAWRIIYAPNNLKRKKWEGTGSFALSKHLGLLENGNNSRLLQVWDRCDPLPHTHAHINPNSITLESFGVPVIIEGYKKMQKARLRDFRGVSLPFAPFNDIFRFGPDDYRDASSLSIGLHNCVLVDNKEIIHPRWDASGKLIKFIDGPIASLLVSDSSPIYETAGIKLLSATRVSMVNKCEGYFLVGDNMTSRTVRKFTWQVYLRGLCNELSGNIITRTREGVGLEIAGMGKSSFELRHISNYPMVFEGSSTRLRRSVSGQNVQFYHLLRPFRSRSVIMDMTDGWTATLGEVPCVPWGIPGSNVTAKWKTSLLEPAFMKKPEALGKWVTYRKKIKLPKILSGTRIFLHLPITTGLSNTDMSTLWINDIPVDVEPIEESYYKMLNMVFDITEFLHSGRYNNILFQVLSSDRGTTGHAFLTKQTQETIHRPAVLKQTQNGLMISTKDGNCISTLFESKLKGTDSNYGLVKDNKEYGALFECLVGNVDDLRIKSDKLISVQWDSKTLWLILSRSVESMVSINNKILIKGKKVLMASVKSKKANRKVEVIWQ